MSDPTVPNHRSASCRKAWESIHARALPVDPDTITFGVEIECLIPLHHIYRLNIAIGDHGHGSPLPAPFPPEWTAQDDSSIRCNGQRTGVEIVSPILRGFAGLQEMCNVLGVLESLNARVNRSCGFHVHIGAKSLLQQKISDPDCMADWVRRLVNTASQFETALFGIAGSISRLDNQYCHSIKSPYAWAGRLKAGDKFPKVSRETYQKSRYHTVNLCNVFGPRGTVEFRVFSGTLNATKAVGYVVTAIGLCQKATESPLAPKFDDQPTAPDYPAAVRKLQSVLWNNGKRKGWPTGAWKRYGKAVVKNQRWNARHLQTTWEARHA